MSIFGRPAVHRGTDHGCFCTVSFPKSCLGKSYSMLLQHLRRSPQNEMSILVVA